MTVQKMYVNCDCGEVIYSGMMADTTTIETNRVKDNGTQCPACKKMVRWSMAELIPESVAKKTKNKS